MLQGSSVCFFLVKPSEGAIRRVIHWQAGSVVDGLSTVSGFLIESGR